MKITSIDAFLLDTGTSRRPIVCRVNTDKGIYGFGESSVGFSAGAPAAWAMIQEMSRYIIGMNPLHHEAVWNRMYQESFWGPGGGLIVFAAISAIDMALWDIKGKAYGVPLYELLGGKQRESLRSYASQLQFGWGKDDFDELGKTEDYAAAAAAAVAEGFDAVKFNFLTYDRDAKRIGNMVGPCENWIVDMIEERVAAVREAVGPNVDIILENHGYTDMVNSVQIGRAVEKYGIFFMEEAATPMNIQAMSEIQSRLTIPLAGGERVYGRFNYNAYFQANALKIAQPDLGTCGGITEGKKICDLASCYDVSVQTHVCGSPIATTASLHLEAAIPNFVIREWHLQNRFDSYTTLGKYDYAPVNGRCLIPDLPGIGQELTQEAMEHAKVATVQ